MNMQQMLYFREAARYQSITRASMELHVSQPAVSKAIHQLETELGVNLFIRKSSRIYLTHEGKVFLPKVNQILVQSFDLEKEMKDYGTRLKNTVSIGVPAAIGTVLLPHINIMISEDLGLELEMFEYDSLTCIRKVVFGELDLAFILSEPQDLISLRHEPIIKTELRYCAQMNSKYKYINKVDPRDLTDEKIIMFYPGNLIKELFESYNIRPKYTLHTNQVKTIEKFLHYGLASTFQFPEVFQDDETILSIPLICPEPLDIELVCREETRKAVDAIYCYTQENKENIRKRCLKNN
jgi:DNA-binding transcriptional LysR family regulator